VNKLLASFLIDTVTPKGVPDSKVIISTWRYRKCREENIDIKEVIAMQISGYSSAAMLAYRSSGMK